jgi:pyridoxal 5'-phosphate synthase pdxS subunit
MAHAIVQAATHYEDAATIAELSRGLGDAMAGIETSGLEEKDLLQTRGW